MNDKLDLIKFRCGIYYSDEIMDQTIQDDIRECEQYLKSSGVPDNLLDDPTATTAKVLWIKKSQDAEAKSIITDPAFIALIAQLRAGGGENEL